MSLIWNRLVDWNIADWRERSACRYVEPSLFFPMGDGVDAFIQTEDAKRICQICPVRSECLDFALQANLESGIWGGTSEDERRKLRRRWLASRRKAPAESGPKSAN